MEEQLKNIRAKAHLLLESIPKCPKWMDTTEQSCELCKAIFPRVIIGKECPNIYKRVTLVKRITDIMNEDWILIPLVNKASRG